MAENITVRLNLPLKGMVQSALGAYSHFCPPSLLGGFATIRPPQLQFSLTRPPEQLFQYKRIPIPPLGMVDDVITVTNVNYNETMNDLVNIFIESKKLKLSKDKCCRLYNGKGHNECPELRVHGGQNER